jgi:protein-tyrosine phosphatase
VWPFSRPQVTLLILCSANVCRSPVAAALLREALRRRGLRRQVRVLSAGTEVAAPGALADPRMVSIAAEIGIRLKGHRAQPLTDLQLQQATVVYAMEPAHLEACAALPGWDGTEGDLLDPQGLPVDDPYFGDKAGVRAAFEHLVAVCDARADEWQQRLAGLARL